MLLLLLCTLACTPDDEPSPIMDDPEPTGDTGSEGTEDTDTTPTGETGPTGDTGATTHTGLPTLLNFEVVAANVDGHLSAASFGDRDGDGLEELLVTAGGYAWSVVAPPPQAPLPTVVLFSAGAPLHSGFGSFLDGGASGDVDGDGLADVWLRTYEVVHLFTSLPAFPTDMADAATATIEVDSIAVLYAGDIDGDGAADVFVHDRDTGELHWFEAPFAGTLTAADAVASWEGTSSSAQLASAGDITGDGLPDVLVSSSAAGRTWLLANPSPADGSLDAVAVAVLGDAGGAVAAGDLDDDGLVDLVVGDPASGPHPVQSTWYVTDTPSGEAELDTVAHTVIHQDLPDVGRCTPMAVADLNADGIDDLAVGCPWGYDQSHVYVVHGPIARGTHDLAGLSSFRLADVSAPASDLGTTLAVVDLDQDGDAELALGATNNATYYAGAGEARLRVTEAP